MSYSKNSKVKFKLDKDKQLDTQSSDYVIYPISIVYLNETFENDDSSQTQSNTPRQIQENNNNINNNKTVKSELIIQANKANYILENNNNNNESVNTPENFDLNRYLSYLNRLLLN